MGNYHQKTSLGKRVSLTLAISSTLAVSSFLHAEEADGQNTKLNNILVTGSHSASSLETQSSSASVLSAEEIKTLNKSNVVDLIRTLPGISISQQGGPGGASDISIRGGESNYVMVLIDGVQVNDPTNTRGGSYNFNQLSVQEIERIELIRGSQSAIYGSDAMSGVINIITQKSRAGLVQDVYASGGEDNYANFGYGISHQGEKVATSLKVSSQATGEQVPGNESDRDAINAGIIVDFDDKISLSTSFRGAQTDSTSFPEQSGGPTFATTNDLEITDARDRSVKVVLSNQVNEKVNFSLASDYFKKESIRNTPGVNGFFMQSPPMEEVIDYDKYTHTALLQYDSLNKVNWNIGLESRREEGANDSLIDAAAFGFPVTSRFDLRRRNAAAFAEASFVQRREEAISWLFSVSARSDRYENVQESYSDFGGPSEAVTDGTEDTFQAGGKFYLVDVFSLFDATAFANYGRAFKLPSFYALGEASVGDPNLLNEFSDTADVGVELSYSDSQGIRLSHFYNRFENLITFANGAIINVTDDVEIDGAEINYWWQATRLIKLNLNATYSHIKGPTTFDARPEWVSNFNLDWKIKNKWNANLAVRWSDEIFSSSLISATNPSVLNAYTVADLAVSYDSDRFGIYQLNIDNLSDEEYQEAIGFPGVGRVVRGTWSLSF